MRSRAACPTQMMCFADTMLPAAFLATGSLAGPCPAVTLVIGSRREKRIVRKIRRGNVATQLIQLQPGGVTALHQGAAVSYDFRLNHPRIGRAIPAESSSRHHGRPVTADSRAVGPGGFSRAVRGVRPSGQGLHDP